MYCLLGQKKVEVYRKLGHFAPSQAALRRVPARLPIIKHSLITQLKKVHNALVAVSTQISIYASNQKATRRKLPEMYFIVRILINSSFQMRMRKKTRSDQHSAGEAVHPMMKRTQRMGEM